MTSLLNEFIYDLMAWKNVMIIATPIGVTTCKIGQMGELF